MDEKTKVIIAKLTAGTIGFIALMFALAWIASPAEWTFKIEMDDNTLEAIKSLNQTGDKLAKATVDAHYAHQAGSIDYVSLYNGRKEGEIVYIWDRCKVSEHSVNNSDKVYADRHYQLIIIREDLTSDVFCELREISEDDWQYLRI